MSNQRSPTRLRAAVGAFATGAVISSLLGPILGTLGLLLFGAVHEHSVDDAISWLKVLPFDLLIALMLMGPAAFVLGGVGALIIRFISTRVGSSKALFFQTAVLGLALGCAIPVLTDLAYAALQGDRNKNFETGLLPLGAVTGLVCAVVVYWLLRRMRLLSFQQATVSDAE